MITSKDVRNKRFEKAAFGYKQEEIDEFLSQLEAELDEMERERAEANNKIQILADKVKVRHFIGNSSRMYSSQ